MPKTTHSPTVQCSLDELALTLATAAILRRTVAELARINGATAAQRDDWLTGFRAKIENDVAASVVASFSGEAAEIVMKEVSHHVEFAIGSIRFGMDA